MPAYPVPRGIDVPDEDMIVIESMPVKSMVTFPEIGVKRTPNTPFKVRGHACAGEQRVEQMHVSIDFGATWLQAELERPMNKYVWQRWETSVQLPEAGYYEIWARATDENGRMQPANPPG